MIKKVINNCIPLCYLPSGRLVCYKHGIVLIYEQGIVVKYIRFSEGLKEKYLSRCNYLNRLLRAGVRAAIALDERTILLSYDNKTFELDLVSGVVSKGYNCDESVQ